MRIPQIALSMLALALCVGVAHGVQINAKPKPIPCQCSVVVQPAAPDLRGTEQGPLVVKATSAKSSEEISKEDQDRAERRSSDSRTLGLGIATAVILVLQLGAFSLQARRLRETIDEMKIATQATRTAALAAEKTADTLDATARRQLRAYVALKDPKVNKLDEQAKPEAIITIRNFGRTPAYRFTVSTQTAFVASFDEAHAVPKPKGVLGHLAPGAEFTIKIQAPFTISNAHYAQLHNGAMSMFVYGIIGYTDTFGADHYTRFRTVIGGSDGMKADRMLITCIEGNETDDDPSHAAAT